MTARCIITSEIAPAALWAELAYVAEFFLARGEASCRILFGYAWGHTYYTGEWLAETCPLDALVAKAQGIEASGLGSLGDDDLYVTLSGLEFLFGHDANLHLRFDHSTEAVEHFYTRWTDLGYRPSEWVRNTQGIPGIKGRAVRGPEDGR